MILCNYCEDFCGEDVIICSECDRCEHLCVCEGDAQNELAKDIEEVFITDDTGRKKIKIDYSDRKKIKEVFQRYHGMKKFKVDKDKAESKLKEFEPRYKELESHWQKVEDTFKNNGIEGLINLIEGSPDAFENLRAKILEEHKLISEATPEQLDKMDLEKRARRAEQEKERILKELDD